MDKNELTNLSLSAQKVQEALLLLKCDCQIIEFKETTRTAAEAAEQVGCQIGQIVKSLIFRGKISGEPVLVLTSGANRVNENNLAQYTSEQIRRADAEFVRATTGFAIGGVPPVGHIHPIKTYIDEDLLQYDIIWAAGGTPNAVFKLNPLLLISLTGGKVIRVKS